MSITRLLNPRGPATANIRSAVGRGFIYDADAETYIAAVEAADGQRLEWSVRQAISQFVVGCKTDGNWTAIKASCILMGARTLAGALTPLAGSAPTNNNFVSGDYDRKNGLLGNGSTKYIDTGRKSSDDGQNDAHRAVFISATHTVNALYISNTTVNGSGDSYLYQQSNGSSSTAKINSGSTIPSLNFTGRLFIGFYGVSRSSSSSFAGRADGVSTSSSVASVAPISENVRVFGTTGLYTNARLAFYSVGTSVTLNTLDLRVTALYYAIQSVL